jgi:hypothetical protein
VVEFLANYSGFVGCVPDSYVGAHSIWQAMGYQAMEYLFERPWMFSAGFISVNYLQGRVMGFAMLIEMTSASLLLPTEDVLFCKT